MKALLTILLFDFFYFAHAQQIPVDYELTNSTQLEDLAEDEETASEDEHDSQQMQYFAKHPVDINSSDVEQITWLDPLLINNLSSYRKLLGDIIDIHELQAVPGFTIEIIKSIQPFITLTKNRVTAFNLRERLQKGEYTALIRPTIVPESSAGFQDYASQKFTGSRPALQLRCKYQYRNLLQYGFVTDKDAGEKLLVNGVPDFMSFHAFARQIGLFNSIAFGDYAVNLGQGLIYWQSQAFRKSSSVIGIKRQSEVLRPYHTAGEYNFNRGGAATIGLGKLESTLFFSAKKLTANVESGVITSVLTSGLHRTPGELNNKGLAGTKIAGFNLKRKLNNGHIGLNGVYFIYSLPVLKNEEPYNLFAIKGRTWSNASADYAYTLRNFHLFGEMAIAKNRSVAVINGIMAAVGPKLDVSVLYRNMSKSYQAVFGNAFTENTTPTNEYGFYSGIAIKPDNKWKIDLYADLFSFPWIKYRLNAPAYGCGYLIQVTHRPDKQTEIYTRFRFRMKPLNIGNVDGDEMVGSQCIQSWRTHLNIRVNRTILLRSRVEVCLFDHQLIDAPQAGYLFYADLVFKPFSSALSGNIRFQAFEAENYDTRIYVYENDLLFSSQIPSYYNNGVRVYMNIKASFRLKRMNDSRLTLNAKVATTLYKNMSEIGSGLNSISGNRISALKLQIFLAR